MDTSFGCPLVRGRGLRRRKLAVDDDPDLPVGEKAPGFHDRAPLKRTWVIETVIPPSTPSADPTWSAS